MKSAPPCRIRRTASRTSSAEFASPNRSSRGTTTSGARPVIAPPPLVTVTYAPAHDILGPTTSPASMASRSATSTNARKVPTSRTVVNPAMRVSHAFRTPLIASCAPVRSRRRAYVPLSISPMRWAWQSMSPGSTVCSERSIIRAPADAGPPPARTSRIRSPSITISWSTSTSPATTSRSRPARTIVPLSLMTVPPGACPAPSSPRNGRSQRRTGCPRGRSPSSRSNG